jgi:hypothetical protein
MKRIRVNTEELKDKSKAFESSAGVFSEAGKELMAFVAGLPSYDGQLSPPARAAALEINRQCQDLHDGFMSDSQSLAKTALAFENVDKQTINILESAQGDIANASEWPKTVNLSFVPPDDSNLFGPFHGFWFTYNSDSWNPFLRGTRAEGFSGKLSNDAEKWIGYEEVLGDPTKVVIWYNPLPPTPLPDPPYIPRVYKKDDPLVKAFLEAEQSLETDMKLIEALMPELDIINNILAVAGLATLPPPFDLSAFIAIIATVYPYIKSLLTPDLSNAIDQYLLDKDRLEKAGQQLFSSDTPYEPYRPYGDEILTSND